VVSTVDSGPQSALGVGQMPMEQQPEKWRLFVSVPLPQRLHEAVGEIQGELRKVLRNSSIRWVPSEQWHLTIRFLGDVEKSRIPALDAALKKAAAEVPCIKLEASGLGFFPNAARPRVIWVGITEAEGRLRLLWEKVCGACADFAESPPENEFVGHITLGRVKFIHHKDVAALAEAAGAFERRRIGEWVAENFLLMKSELSKTGARHICAGKFELSKQ